MPSVANRGRGGRRTINEINMVPFIDVMLVLLIIFMVTAPLITPSMIDLPSIGKAAKQPDKIIQIVVGDNDAVQMKVKNQTMSLSLERLAAAVKQEQSYKAGSAGKSGLADANTAVVISADKNVKYERVVKVMDTLQRAGIVRVGLSVQLAP